MVVIGILEFCLLSCLFILDYLHLGSSRVRNVNSQKLSLDARLVLLFLFQNILQLPHLIWCVLLNFAFLWFLFCKIKTHHILQRAQTA